VKMSNGPSKDVLFQIASHCGIAQSRRLAILVFPSSWRAAFPP
jgi:hypothetical protein